MREKKKKRKIKLNKKHMKILIGILVVILIILIYIVALAHTNTSDKETASELLTYINSDDLTKTEEGTFSPKLIHVVTAAYEGDLPAVSISKSTYYVTTELIPEILKQCKNDKKTEKYYKNNQEKIEMTLGVTNLENFKKIVSEIQKLSGSLTYESSTFETDSVEKVSNGVYANLVIKYENNDEIKFKLFIENDVYTYRSSITYNVAD